ncbi:histone deacetylase complex subunit SAP130-like [Haliotis rufescens]|uniref:histone deacetylase complex subunit SAP130-like n=1 Tax=Haliotis rufescens TaxID=6454 RepID=UPI00201F36F6|nr:histone deacetylase complex subunit SAP130-like [Haliotis rufescens]
MSSANFPGGGGERRGEDKPDSLPPAATPTLSGTPSHIQTQQPIMDIKLQTIRPKINQSVNLGHPHQQALSAMLPTGLVSTPTDGVHGHIATTPSSGLSAGSHGQLSAAVSNLVHLSASVAGGATQALGNALPLNVITRTVPPRPPFASHLPRGAIAAAALSKTSGNIATAAPAVVRPPVQIPVSSSAIHGAGVIPTIQPSLGRSPILSAIKQATPPSTRSPSPAVNISTSQQPETHRSGFAIHGQPPTSNTQNIQITLTTTRSTTAIEIPKPVNTHSQQKPLNVPNPMSIQAPSKVIVSQTVNPLLPHLAKPVSLSMTGHISSASAMPLTPGSITTTTTVASTPSTIPIAKVTPQRQQQTIPQPNSVSQSSSAQDLSRTEAPTSSSTHPHGQPAGGLFIPQTHRIPATTAPITTAVAAPSSTPQQQDSRLENRTVGNIPQLPHLFSQTDLWQSYPLQYQQLVYQQVAAQAAQNPLSTPITTPTTTPVRPGPGTLIFPRPQVEQSVPSQNPNLAATLQAHGMTMGQTQTLRFTNSMMVQVDPRHPMSTMHTQFATTAAAAAAITSGASLPQQDSKPTISATLCRTPPPASMHDASHNMSLSTAATVASSIYTSSPNMQTQSSSINNPSASPRPSILRKRTSEGAGVVVKRPIGLMPDNHSPRPEPSQPQSNTSSPKTPAGDNNSQSSTDTALSSNDATTPTQNSHLDVKIKQEPPDAMENGPSSLNSLASSPVSNSLEASPRKKPRKQLLNATEELKDNTSTDEEVEKVSGHKDIKPKEIKEEQRDEFVDDDGVRWTSEKKRPNINLLNFYNITWKPKNNHFQRFTDVKPKEERRPTVNELSNQRGIHQRSSGWKLYHMASQLENLNDLEKDMCARISQLQAALAPRAPAKQAIVEDYDGIIHELSQANIQRCQLIGDQLEEARSSMLKILEHKPRIQEIINKHMSKRPIKKKERT